MRSRSPSWLALALAVAGGVFAAPARAERLAPDGRVHGVAVESRLLSGRTDGTWLRHTIHAPDGTKTSLVVPGTDDAALEREPAVAIDFASGDVVLVWARGEGSGWRLWASRFTRDAWTPGRPLDAAQVGDGVSPQVRAGAELVHVAWRFAGSTGPGLVRASYDKTSFALRFGPEWLAAADVPVVPPAGGAPAGDGPCDSEAFFAETFPALARDENGRVIVWGVRDEPVPVGDRWAFLVPAGANGVPQSAEARWVESVLVVWYRSDARLYYATRRPDEPWTEQRIVEIPSGSDVAAVKLETVDMLARSAHSTP